MEIRKLIAADRLAIESILARVGVFTQEEISCAMDLVKISLNSCGSDEYEIYCAVDASGRVQGYICFGKAPLTKAAYDLYWIAVDPEFHGGPAAQELLGFAEKTIRSRGAAMMLIDTSSQKKYLRARNFYSKNGYRAVAKVKDYYAPGDHRLTYKKKFKTP